MFIRAGAGTRGVSIPVPPETHGTDVFSLVWYSPIQQVRRNSEGWIYGRRKAVRKMGWRRKVAGHDRWGRRCAPEEERADATAQFCLTWAVRPVVVMSTRNIRVSSRP